MNSLHPLIAFGRRTALCVSAAGALSVSSAMSADIELPPCGILVGNAIYNAGYGFPVFSGPVLTHWKSYTQSPLELTERTVKENQGNIIQYWWAGSWNRYYDYPQSRAHYLALEDLGVKIPPPDWENLKNISLDEFPEFEKYKDRAGLGMYKCFKRCEELGLYSMMIYLPSDANERYTKRFKEFPHYLGYDFGERFGFGHCLKDMKGDIRLDRIAGLFRDKVAAHIRENREKGYGRISATSSNFHMDYEVAAGLDFTFFEDCTAELNFISAFSRGLMRQYGLELWGSHVADEHYQWLPWSNPHRKETCRASMLMKYMAGAKVIINESGAWDNQTTMSGAPMKHTPRIPYPLGTKLSPEMIRPYGRELHKTAHLIDDPSEFCRHYRKVMSDFYDFVKANPAPSGQPETAIAVVKGNYDLSWFGDGFWNPNTAIAGLRLHAEKNPNWFSGAPERGWQAAADVFWPTPQGIFGTDDLNHTFSATPWGQVDIVSFAFYQPSADFLLKNYRLLIFSGWNTCSERQYRTLCEYVRKGGKLFISIPQLSMDVTRNYMAYGVQDLVKGGDFSELCGVKVKGRGQNFYWATGTAWTPNEWGLDYNRRFGIFFSPLGDIEFDPSAETLVQDHESQKPILLKIRKGEGTVYFFNSWYYPGYFTSDRGTGAKVGENLISFIWRRLAQENRGGHYITECGSELPGKECGFINVSHFPSTGETMLFNVDFTRSHTFDLHSGGKVQRIELGPSEFKTMQQRIGKDG